MSWAEFHFIRPLFLLALLGLAIIVWLARRAGASGGAWAQVCDPRLREFVLDSNLAKAGRWLPGMLVLCAALLIIAAAGPTIEREPTPVFKDPSAVVIALDLSRSMQAGDLEPSRLVRARFKIADLLERRRDGQTALLVFAAGSFVVSPLTDDTRTIASQLPALVPELMPAQGSRPDIAITKAAELIEQAGLRSGDVLLVTDDAPDSAMEKAIELAKDSRLRISVLGVGTTEGAPVPKAAGRGFIQDRNGEIITSRLLEKQWRKLAAAGSGVYRKIRNDDIDTESLLNFFDNTMKADSDRLSEVTADAWRDLGPWLVVLVLPFVALAFRRGVILTVPLVPLMLFSPGSEAFEWKDLWQRPDQQAAAAMAEGDAQRAASLFQDPKWAAAANYRNGDYEAAVDLLEEHADAASLYNRGNALAQQGDYEAALAAYDESLALNPEDEDASYNRKLIEDLLKQQREQQQQGDGENADEDQDGEQGEGESSGDNQQQQDQQQQQEQNSASSQGEDGNEGEDEGEQSAPENENAENEQSQADGEQDSADSESNPEQPNESEQQGEQTEQDVNQADSRPAEESDGDAEERAQAVEQWLRRIPDDPGGLLRRKFLYQYRQLPQRRAEEQQW